MKDLSFDVSNRDIIYNKDQSSITLYDCVWGKLFDTDVNTFSYLNVIVPSEVASTLSDGSTHNIRIKAAYYPSNYPIVVRLVTKGGNAYTLYRAFDTFSYASDWLNPTPIGACVLPIVNPDGLFLLTLSSNRAYIYSGYVSDYVVEDSNNQESKILTLCDKGDLYRYPISGVGVYNYINSIPSYTNVGSVLINEFQADDKNIVDAEFDNTTGELSVQCNNMITENSIDIENVSSDIISMTSNDMRNNIYDNAAYTINWLYGSSANLTYSPTGTQTVNCTAQLKSNIVGTFSYRIISGSEFGTLNANTNILTLSSSKAGGTIIVEAAFTPSDGIAATITSQKTITYNKAKRTIAWKTVPPDNITVGETIDLQATTTPNSTVKYKVNGMVVLGSYTPSSVGTLTVEAIAEETDIYKAVSIKKVVTAISAISSSSQIYVGASTGYNTVPDSNAKIFAGTTYDNINNVVFSCKNKGWKTIWIAIPNGYDIDFDGTLYDIEHDTTLMAQVPVGTYQVWYWTQMIEMTQTYSTIKATE